MKTKFNIGESVNIVGNVDEITADRSGTWYEVKFETCSGTRTFTFKENMLLPIKEDEK